jgi:hypothetical protein
MSASPGPVRRVLASAGLALALLIAACSSGGSPTPTSSAPGPSPAATPTPGPTAAGLSIVLEVTSEGGFINPVSSLAALPTVVVYSDGRILTQGPPPADMPDALLPRVSVRDVGLDGVAAIQGEIAAAGLDRPQTGDPGVAADSGTSVFKISSEGAVVTTRFAANGPGGPGGPEIPGGGDNPERTAAFALLDRLLDPGETWGAASAPETVYAPLGYRIFAAPGAPAGDASSTVAWPLAGDLAAFGSPAIPDLGVAGLRSGVVLGADAATLGPALDAATAETSFTSGSASYTLYARPLLPHELPG